MDMVRIILLLSLLLDVSSAGLARQTQTGAPPPPPPPANDYFPKRWKEFLSPEGGFKVLLPGTPSVSEEIHKSQFGDLVIHKFSYKGVIGNDVVYVDYPSNVEDPSVVKKFFDEMRDSGIANIANGSPRIIKETDLSVSGHPGRFLQIELADGTVLRVKYIVLKNRVYNLIATSRKAHPNVMGSENDYQEIAMAFLDSFQFTKF